MKWNPWRLLTVVGIVAAVAVAGPVVPIKTTTVWCCQFSGSTRIRTSWLGGFPRETGETSKLETWLRKREPKFEPYFKIVSKRSDCLIGRSYESASAPVIYKERFWLDLVIRRSSDERIAALVATLRNGSNEEQRRVFSEIVDEAIEAESKSFQTP